MQFAYELQAKRGEPMPDGLSLVEQAGYQAVANLTARYKAGAVTAEQAKAESMAIDKAVRDGLVRERYIKHTSDLWADVEYAAIQYRKEPTIEHANEVMDIIYGFLRYTEEERAAHKEAPT